MNVVIIETDWTLCDVLDFRRAGGDGLKVALQECRWGELLDEAHFVDSHEKFCNHLIEFVLRCIPKKTILKLELKTKNNI